MSKTLKRDEYVNLYLPLGAWVLIEKDVMPKQVGMIHVPQKAREDHTKWACTGVIVSVNKGNATFENQYEALRYNQLQVGDRVGFSSSIPHTSPLRPDYKLEEDCDGKFVTLHVADIFAILFESDAEKKAWEARNG